MSFLQTTNILPSTFILHGTTPISPSILHAKVPHLELVTIPRNSVVLVVKTVESDVVVVAHLRSNTRVLFQFITN